MIIKCVIIDDEALAIKVIEDHLKNFDQIEVVATYTNPLKAYSLLEREKIDVVFLDQYATINRICFYRKFKL